MKNKSLEPVALTNKLVHDYIVSIDTELDTTKLQYNNASNKIINQISKVMDSKLIIDSTGTKQVKSFDSDLAIKALQLAIVNAGYTAREKIGIISKNKTINTIKDIQNEYRNKTKRK